MITLLRVRDVPTFLQTIEKPAVSLRKLKQLLCAVPRHRPDSHIWLETCVVIGSPEANLVFP